MYPPLSKKQARYIRQLALKKSRLKQNIFILEGKKSIQALLATSYTIQYIVGTPIFFTKNQDIINNIDKDTAIFSADQALLSQLGHFTHNQEVLAVVARPLTAESPPIPPQGIILALDNIQNPGNLGTMIRIASWYNIITILCAKTTVELYNPKTLQASMGSFLEINIYYIDLPAYLPTLHLPIIGALPEGGHPLHHFNFPNQGILVIGNESHGISSAVKQILTYTITIPRYGHAESLNAAIATAVICDNWKKMITNG